MRFRWAALLILAAAAEAKSPAEGRWFLRMERPGMIPAVVTGSFTLSDVGGELHGTWRFTELSSWDDVPLAQVSVRGRSVAFAVVHPKYPLEVAGALRRGEIAGRCVWGGRSYELRAWRDVPRFEKKVREKGFFPRAKKGCDDAALNEFLLSAEAMDSDALIVLKDGETICERYFQWGANPMRDRAAPGSQAFFLMSVTKSVAALAVPFLVAEGKVSSLDAPLSTWFDDWKDGEKAKVTLRHVLDHTSGLEHEKAAGKLNEATDGTAFARNSSVVTEPGVVFSYNNRAVQLLPGVVEAAAGEPLDRYLEQRLFGPMDVKARWHRDPAGNVRAYADLRMTARDLAKIGQLLLDDGRWEGKQLLPAGWAARLTAPSERQPGCGLLWWRLEDGRGFHASGDMGQYLAVLPAAGIVAVRLRDLPREADPTAEHFHGFRHFYAFLPRLVPGDD